MPGPCRDASLLSVQPRPQSFGLHCFAISIKAPVAGDESSSGLDRLPALSLQVTFPKLYPLGAL